MTLDEAIRRNPYNPELGNKSAYCRFLRYNVDGWYQLDSKEVLRRWQKVRKKMTESQKKQIEWICEVLGIKYEGQNIGDAWKFIHEHIEEAKGAQKELDDSWDRKIIGG